MRGLDEARDGLAGRVVRVTKVAMSRDEETSQELVTTRTSRLSALVSESAPVAESSSRCTDASKSGCSWFTAALFRCKAVVSGA